MRQNADILQFKHKRAAFGFKKRAKLCLNWDMKYYFNSIRILAGRIREGAMIYVEVAFFGVEGEDYHYNSIVKVMPPDDKLEKELVYAMPIELYIR